MTSMYQPYQQPWGGAYPQPTCPQPSYQKPVEGLVRVTGLDGAKMYQLPPNSSMPLFDANGDVFYVKTTDGAGFYTIRTFRFVPVDEQPGGQEGWATRGELLELARQIEELKGALHHDELFDGNEVEEI